MRQVVSIDSYLIDGLLEIEVEYRDKLIAVRQSVKTAWTHARSFTIPYMNYDEQRCNEIEKTIIDLLDLRDTDSRQNIIKRFSPEERFILVAAIWLHDIGMCPILDEVQNYNVISGNPIVDGPNFHNKQNYESVKGYTTSFSFLGDHLAKKKTGTKIENSWKSSLSKIFEKRTEIEKKVLSIMGNGNEWANYTINPYIGLELSDQIIQEILKNQFIKYDEKIRENHPQRAVQFIQKNKILNMEGGLTDRERDILTTICYYHRGTEKIPSDFHDKIKLIIAYIRIAEVVYVPKVPVLDSFKRRFHIHGMESLTKFHWIKSFFILSCDPSKKDSTIAIRYKKPHTWGPQMYEELPLITQFEETIRSNLNIQIEDIINSVKEIMILGKFKYNLPVYTNLKYYFETTVIDVEKQAEMVDILSIIELFNPTISPNSGKIIDIVLNQLGRIVSTTPSHEETLKRIKAYKQNILQPLLEDRPCHAFLWNILDWLNKELDKSEPPEITAEKNVEDTSEEDNEKFFQIRVDSIRSTIERMKVYRKKIGREIHEKGKDRINTEDSLLLYGYSGSVISVLKYLDEKIKENIQVFVCECSTKNRHLYNNKLIYCDGYQYLNELKKIGIKKLRYVPDASASKLFDKKIVKKVFFGANGINSEGNVFHSLGHLAITDMARRHNIPVYVVAEGMKIRETIVEAPNKMRKGKFYPTDISYEEIFDDLNIKMWNFKEDVVPSKEITEIITEQNIFNPNKEQSLKYRTTIEDITKDPKYQSE